MPGSVRVPLELMSMVSLATAFGCAISYALHLGTFSTTSLKTPDDDLEQFTMVISLSQSLVVSSGIGACVLIMTSINAVIHSCIKARANNSCSFEPSASALGIGQEYQAIVPPVTRSRPPTLYVPRKPMPKHLERMPETDDEKTMAEEFAKLARVGTGLSNESRDTFDVEKMEIQPLNPRRSQPLHPRGPQSTNTRRSQPLHPRRSQRVAPVRPARPWSEVPQPRYIPQPRYNPGPHAL